MVTVTKLWLEDIGSGGKATADNCRFSFSRHFHFLKIKRKMQIIESISLFIFDWIEEKNNILHSFNLLINIPDAFALQNFAVQGGRCSHSELKLGSKFIPLQTCMAMSYKKTNLNTHYSTFIRFWCVLKHICTVHILNLGLSGSVGCQYFWFTRHPHRKGQNNSLE